MSIILKNKRVIIFLIVVFVALLTLPLFFFILNFNSNILSNDISDWASFGDYLGGTINTLISLFSLIILGYLTYLVSEQSNAENKKNNILMRRMDAYDELTAFFPQVNQFLLDFAKSANTILDKVQVKPLDDYLIREKQLELNKQILLFKNFYSLLFSFNVRYGHLFEYNFNSEDYIKIVQDANILKVFFEETIDFLHGNMETPNMIEDNLMRNFFDDLVRFINQLRKELN
ncbi:hypothetical protein [Flavobacterium sharifuzzamanii]|uniref:hypothetical protein n=1 Tax=Flavobacterium sharifuzzamanii TaxID=2211133 RepID=UPI000DADF171|nr:hypothetical protein [Flavobacterium sharifuzzamanii]KAF2080262.1 hypothetical protein DMA14_13245 [Flavobacterium sharifuzzamanii]